MDPPFLSVSIVVYEPDIGVLVTTLQSLHRAVLQANVANTLWLIDNRVAGASRDPTAHPEVRESLARFEDVRLLSGHGNVGFGRGHDLAITATHSRYHLVLNPDVELASDSVLNAITWLGAHPEFGVLVPRTTSPDGRLQYLCRRYPSLCVLFLRGFGPKIMRRLFRQRLAAYEMKVEIDAESIVLDPPLVSGCFMFCRTDALTAAKGFDPRFFLYFEDYDLSLRLGRSTRLAYVPDVRIMHSGGDTAKKGLRHVMMFVRSAVQFFQLHGWRVC
jgi:GT2 family glycosyltransferase